MGQRRISCGVFADMGCELLDSAAGLRFVAAGLNQMNDPVEFVYFIDALLNAAFAKSTVRSPCKEL